MADYDIPPDAIKAQQAYDAADAEVQRLISLMPSGVAVAAGEATIPPGLADELQRARLARLARMEELRDLDWWQTVDDPIKAEMALRKAARPGDAPEGTG
ncbi:hypothetical protein [Nonomuraea sp. SYSU D8015]|uniref:hypothetical protein n=1 Tax=Nonomuraea sp. SYSU D8015 TaxID=2593644 RepID=UPI00166137FA|nr:hypothetical protein [Nonomuraea sp. SYSU D8015]